MPKVVVIALDGATLDLLQPWMDGGHLPLLKRLFSDGAGGTLNSTIPWATPTAFASYATGMNPGKHGIYDFGTLIGDDYTAFVPTSGAHVQGKTLWRRLTDAGLSSVVVNMPMTYPAEPIDGVLVSGIPYPSGSSKLCHPPEILDQLKQQGWDLAKNASDDLGGNYAAYFEGLTQLVESRGAATAWLIREKKPDFVSVHFLEPDQVQHRFWQFMAGEPKHHPTGPHTNAIRTLFQTTEAAMQQIIDAAGPDATICVMSDHGFGPTRQQVWINNWLIENGFLVLKPSRGIQFKQLIYRMGLSPAAIREMAPERLKLAILQFFERQKGRALASQLEDGAAPTVQRKGIVDKLTERLALDFYDVDWQRTVAFSTGTTAIGNIYLNVDGRDPQGIVSAETYHTTRQRIAHALESWQPVGRVRFGDEVWHGPQIKSAPDIVIEWTEPTTDARYFQTRISSHHLSKPVPNDYASHRPNGLFAFAGPTVKQQTLNADILDLAPTILWLFDLPVSTLMDGRALTECFSHMRPVEFVTENWEDMTVKEAETLSDEDEAAIRQSLRGLGYLE